MLRGVQNTISNIHTKPILKNGHQYNGHPVGEREEGFRQGGGGRRPREGHRRVGKGGGDQSQSRRYQGIML